MKYLRASLGFVCASLQQMLPVVRVLAVLAAAGLLGQGSRALARTSAGDGVSYAAWAIGDVDGDRKPDLVSASSTGYHQGEYNYRLHFGLGAADTVNDFSVTTREWGLRLSLRDVDGDDDTDLVITSSTNRPVGIWINDGHGRYTQVDWRLYPASIWQESDRSVRTAVPPASDPLSVHETPSWTGLLPARWLPGTPPAHAAPEVRTHCAARSVRLGPCSPRAPPSA